MKILFSDYDGTFRQFISSPNFFDRIQLHKDINSVIDFRNAGNKFIITTGRSIHSIRNEVKKYHIPYDYLMGYDGRVCINSEDDLIYSKTIPDQAVNSLEFYASIPKNVKNVILFNECGITSNYEDIIYMLIKPGKAKELTNFLRNLSIDYPILDYYTVSLTGYLFLAVKFNKSMGVKELLHKEKINANLNDIYSIGNGINDLELLKDFNGHKTLISPFLSDIKSKSANVRTLIKKINR